MNNTLGASRNRQLYANKELVMAEDGFHGTNPHWTTLRITTFECSLGARAVSVCCDTAQAFVFRAGVSVLWHSPSLGVRAVSMCCDTAQAMVFVLRQCVVTQPKPWCSCCVSVLWHSPSLGDRAGVSALWHSPSLGVLAGVSVLWHSTSRGRVNQRVYPVFSRQFGL